MNLFLGLLTDPFVPPRRRRGAAGSAAQFAEDSDANAYASSGKPRTKSEREAYAAIYRKRPIRRHLRSALERYGRGLWRSQTTDGNAVLGSNYARAASVALRVAPTIASRHTRWRFRVLRRRTSSASPIADRRSEPVPGRRFVRHHPWPCIYLRGAGLWLAGRYHRSHGYHRRLRSAAREFQCHTFSGPRRGRYRFVAPWIGGVAITPYAAGQFTTFDLPAYASRPSPAPICSRHLHFKSVTDTRSELGVRTDKSYPMQMHLHPARPGCVAHDFNPDRQYRRQRSRRCRASFVVNGAAQASGRRTGHRLRRDEIC